MTGITDCSQCQLLETIRYDRIKQYCRLFEERQRSPAKAVELARKIHAIEQELNQAWRQLDLHRRSHASSTAKG
jgi:hypothetical protein